MTEVLAAVDIGTNSMRLLITGDGEELGRWQRVTGLGRGVDATGRLSDEAIDRTVAVLADYGELMRSHGVTRARAVATSASRDARNAGIFLRRAEDSLGVRPEVITGAEEARLAYTGASSGIGGDGRFLVVDIGGGSTEFVWCHEESILGVSIDIGSVRLTERVPVSRPATFAEVHSAAGVAEAAFDLAVLPPQAWSAIGVAGTWTSLAAVAADLPAYDRAVVHGYRLARHEVERLVARFASLTVEQTAAIPALDPARAPVILAGAIVAREAMRHAELAEITVSEKDLLDGIIASLG